MMRKVRRNQHYFNKVASLLNTLSEVLNDALFAVAYLGFGVEAYPEGSEADAAAEEDDPPPEPKKKKCQSHFLAHDAIKEENLIYIHIDLETGGEAV
jgi:hypothetical protein